ncbi:leucine--tRNA ligase [Streptomyces rapamycinicus]|uniref:Leucine--tRNA ligase n=2 Tax=Streptomyces rapamycinicus TaxID=1226757 RepID=A0A0A0NL58_STRRN|nr:leucine--tRNA ligase [Streptomyces rapamycinicus]AGP57891.1 leucyl-tRNA synthetase [Streptomyces rapamycinicus NRRL 5491]MBB4785559.1 leucyl-tRNA synthetase [Streptomyces rapamycinicus]RLV78975.1 leucine--tRNA ligase [Streptomyces rapamycinicus NRRL 5491]UTO65729.1 leucine--tRNA ligase [Streptomyces rapamycinicus]UTP33686.1 leucine--tRNA ligase [Streptomyces rapamycinicus NRRL 5491]
MSETNAAAEVAAPHRYTAALAADVEARWQDFWDAHGTYEAPNPSGDLAGDAEAVARPKKFVMDMFPYPSGAGLHVGHPLGYIATDVFARYHRMTGHNVLHTLGFDAFGLPAEQYAVQTGTHPRVSTEANIENMRRQLRRLGLGHDNRRSFATIDPDYYKWTQWIFLQIFNSWYDPEAKTARPIDTLVQRFASGERTTPDGRPWAELTESERADILGDYRLAYASDAPVNWCPGLGTVLANEEVTADGRSERGNFPVFKAKLRQWNMRITAYADRLLDDLDELDWPEAIKLQQRNWIGRSEGARVDFPVAEHPDAKITIFTTRQDTLFGATYMVLAPEHGLVDEIVPAAWPEGTHDVWTGGHATPVQAVDAYRKQAAAKSDVERQAEVKEKTGVFTGAYAVNPVSGDRVPVFIADYVLMGYGTGAIMAVPAHDGRDFAFARAFELPMRCVVEPSDDRGTDPSTWDDAFGSYDAKIVNSAGDGISLDGLGVTEAKARITEWLEARSIGEGTVNYRLRDWLFSRQRYWGEPFPIVYDEEGVAHPLPESMLPLELPEVEDYSPRTFDPDDSDTSPETPLSRNEAWVNVVLDLGDGRGPRPFRRETNTMPNWAGSCWYELRYLDPHNSERLVDPDAERYWMGPREGQPHGGVDLYVGGAEHAVLHLLYARFWSKVLFDLGHVSSVEPFHKLYNQGMIQAYVYRDSRGIAVPAAEVEERDGAYWYNGEKVTRLLGKMGKSLKNAVTPDEICAEYGADTLRLYEMAMGPLDVSRPWDPRAVVGQYRLLQRLWRNVVDEGTGEVTVVDTEPDEATLRALHKAIDGVRQDMEGLRFNTAIAKITELNNHVTKVREVPRSVAEGLVLLIAPLAPHVAEELWRRLGHSGSVVHESFPVADPEYVVDETVTCVVQVKGKVKARLEVAPSVSDEELEALAVGDPAVVAALNGAGIRKVIVRAPKLVNIVPA